jgi:hypothetical protein
MWWVNRRFQRNLQIDFSADQEKRWGKTTWEKERTGGERPKGWKKIRKERRKGHKQGR